MLENRRLVKSTLTEKMRSFCLKGDFNKTPNHLRWFPITLVEVLVVLILLTTVLGLTAVSAVHFLNSQKFLSRVDQVIDQLQLAQDVMTYFDADVEVVLEKKDHRVSCRLNTQAPLPDILAKRFKKIVWVPHVERVYWKNQEVSSLALVFQTNREHYPLGSLVFLSSIQDQQISLMFSGYPAAIKLGGHRLENTFVSSPPYPQEVYGTTTVR